MKTPPTVADALARRGFALAKIDGGHAVFATDLAPRPGADERIAVLYLRAHFRSLADQLEAALIESDPAPAEPTVICKACGGGNVEHVGWVDANSHAYRGDLGSWNSPGETWCADCNEHQPLIDASAEPEAFAATRAAWHAVNPKTH